MHNSPTMNEPGTDRLSWQLIKRKCTVQQEKAPIRNSRSCVFSFSEMRYTVMDAQRTAKTSTLGSDSVKRSCGMFKNLEAEHCLCSISTRENLFKRLSMGNLFL